MKRLGLLHITPDLKLSLPSHLLIVGGSEQALLERATTISAIFLALTAWCLGFTNPDRCNLIYGGRGTRARHCSFQLPRCLSPRPGGGIRGVRLTAPSPHTATPLNPWRKATMRSQALKSFHLPAVSPHHAMKAASVS